MKEDFDLPKIARIVLGRYWQGTSDTERQQFSDAFADYTVRMYSARFADYSADSFRVVGQRAQGEIVTVVSTEITPSGQHAADRPGMARGKHQPAATRSPTSAPAAPASPWPSARNLPRPSSTAAAACRASFRSCA